MKQSEALEYVDKLIIGFQRAKSVANENMEMGYKDFPEHIKESVLEDLNPWLFGNKGEAFFKALLSAQEQKRVTGVQFMNFMTIIHRLDPTLQALIGILTETNFPEPSLDLLSSFDVKI